MGVWGRVILDFKTLELSCLDFFRRIFLRLLAMYRVDKMKCNGIFLSEIGLRNQEVV